MTIRRSGGRLVCTAGDRESWAPTATATPTGGRLHYARSERIQLRVYWWLTSAPAGAHDAVRGASLR
jgi:hypothetical protein